MNLQERFARGDPDAFEAIFRQSYAEVYGWLVRLVRDPAAAEDLTVEVFWRIHRSHALFDPSRPFGAWARRIASNAAIDYLRRQRRVRAAPPARSMEAPDSSASRDLHVRVERAYGQLPAKLRVVAELALIEDWPQSEIASALGISRSAVKSRAARAMRSLRAAFVKEGIEP